MSRESGDHSAFLTACCEFDIFRRNQTTRRYVCLCVFAIERQHPTLWFTLLNVALLLKGVGIWQWQWRYVCVVHLWWEFLQPSGFRWVFRCLDVDKKLQLGILYVAKYEYTCWCVRSEIDSGLTWFKLKQAGLTWLAHVFQFRLFRSFYKHTNCATLTAVRHIEKRFVDSWWCVTLSSC